MKHQEPYKESVSLTSSSILISKARAIFNKVRKVGLVPPDSNRYILPFSKSQRWASSTWLNPFSNRICLILFPSFFRYSASTEVKRGNLWETLGNHIWILLSLLAIFVSVMRLKALVFFLFVILSSTVNAQIETIWETNHPVGNDKLEIMFHKQDSVGNHYTGGAIDTVYFISKFNSSGVHQWTHSGDFNLNRFPEYPLFDTQTVIRSWFSDIVIDDSVLYISGTKQYPSPGNHHFNFILKLKRNGDSIGFRNVVKDDIPLSDLWSDVGFKPIIKVFDNQVYLFTSMWAGANYVGTENITFFKYNKNLNRLNYRVFDGFSTFSTDKIIHTELFDNMILIHSLSGSQPRDLVCDSSFVVIWDKAYGIAGTNNSKTITPIIEDSIVYNFSSLKDTSRKRPAPDYFGYTSHIKGFNVFTGNLVDSTFFNETTTSDDFITDALINQGNIYVSGISIDSGVRSVFLRKFDRNLNYVNKVKIGVKPLGDVQMESSDCILYVSFIDSLSTGRVLKLLRFSEDLNPLSENIYLSGKDRILSELVLDKQIYLLSSGLSGAVDTISLKHLTDTIVITEPVSFSASALTPRNIELNWQLSGGLGDSVLIYRSTDSNALQLWKTFPASETTFTDSSLAPSTRYYYSIIARWQNEYSCSQLSASDSTPFNTGVIDITSSPFRVYPNPSKYFIYIDGKESIEVIEILTVTGLEIRRVHRKKRLDITDLPPGIYLLRVNELFTHRIIKL